MRTEAEQEVGAELSPWKRGLPLGAATRIPVVGGGGAGAGT